VPKSKGDIKPGEAMIWRFFLILALWVPGFESGLTVITQEHRRLYPNVSLGLGLDGMMHQCDTKGDRTSRIIYDKKSMGYTPNRRMQNETGVAANLEQLQLAFVLALGGHEYDLYNYGNGGSLNGLTAVWDSWVENFFSRTSNSTSLVLLLDERDFNKQNHTRNKEKYVDILLRDNLGAVPVECVNMHPNKKGHVHTGSLTTERRSHRPREGAGGGAGGGAGAGAGGKCDNKVHLDQTYYVYSYDVRRSGNSTKAQAPLVVFVAVHSFPRPAWADGQDEDTLFIHWRPTRLPKRFATNYGYTKMTNWYAFHMLNLRLLDYFDYAGKLDNDVSFVKPFPEPNLPKRMQQGGRKVLVTQKQWYYDDPRIATGVEPCLAEYMKEESKRCVTAGGPKDALQPAGWQDQTFWESNFNATFRAHFLVFWLGLYSAPEVKSLARHWNEWHPHGMWDYRWGDQQWWPRPISMFEGEPLDASIDHYNLIDSDNGKYVVHKAYPLQATLRDVNYFRYEGSTPAQRKEGYKKVYSKYVY
jgi:hypothetical protein